MQIFRNLEHNVKRNLTSRLSILSLSPLVGVPSKPCKNQIAVKNLRIVAQWWTSAEGHLLRMYFSQWPSYVFLRLRCCPTGRTAKWEFCLLTGKRWDIFPWKSIDFFLFEPGLSLIHSSCTWYCDRSWPRLPRRSIAPLGNSYPCCVLLAMIEHGNQLPTW